MYVTQPGPQQILTFIERLFDLPGIVQEILDEFSKTMTSALQKNYFLRNQDQKSDEKNKQDNKKI